MINLTHAFVAEKRVTLVVKVGNFPTFILLHAGSVDYFTQLIAVISTIRGHQVWNPLRDQRFFKKTNGNLH